MIAAALFHAIRLFLSLRLGIDESTYGMFTSRLFYIRQVIFHNGQAEVENDLVTISIVQVYYTGQI